MKQFYTRLLYLLLVVVLFACSKASRKQEQGQEIKLKDALGREVVLKSVPKKIMGLAPSSTELLAIVCDDSMIVGRTTYCNYPKQILDKPAVNAYPPDIEKILKLKPDLILTKTGMMNTQDADKLTQLGIPVYFQKVDFVADVPACLHELGQILHREKQAELAEKELKNAIEAVSAESSSTKPNVLILISSDPLYVYGRNSYATDLLKLAGSDNAIKDTLDSPFPAVSREYILKINPDFILATDSLVVHETLWKLYPELKKTNAYVKKQLFVVNDDLISRPGPRIAEAVTEIKRVLKNAKR